MRLVLGIAIAGFLGAITRYGLGLWFPQSTDYAFPWMTLFINLSGSLMLGYLMGLILRRRMPAWVGDVIGTGFLGSYTTFSAFNGQLWQLLEHHAYMFAAAYVLLSAVGGWLLAMIGLRWGRGTAS
jgi:CrcB protein